MQHYLMSAEIPGGAMHAYIMAIDNTVAELAKQRFCQMFEEAGRRSQEAGFLVLPIILVTGPLTTCIDDIQAITIKQLPEAAEKIPKTKEILFVSFVLAEDDPDNKTLMDIH